MKPPLQFSTVLLSSLILLNLAFLISSQPASGCRTTCGKIPIKYPFGTGRGCGDPRFQNYVQCNSDQLTFITRSGCYPVASIDYSKQIIYVDDPSMSSCCCSQPSKGFSLDWNAPFSFTDDNVFTLLDCSLSSSPIFKSNNNNNYNYNYNYDNAYGKNYSVPLCDKQGAPICSFLYSCRAISMMNLPISSCCVYTPVDLGPAFEMDLEKLKCSSYSAFYSFSGQETNPDKWKYGISLKYKFNVYDEYPSMCASCEKSNGACGYGGIYNSYICNCLNGINTTTDCYFGYNNSPRLLPRQTGKYIY